MVYYCKEVMINSTMPVASPLMNTMLEVDSPRFLTDNNKNFFDYAAATDEAVSFYAVDCQDIKTESALSPPGINILLDSDFISMDAMEDVYVTADTVVVGGEEEVVGMEVEGGVPSIPITALELVMEDGERLQLSYLEASTLAANLPTPLGSHPATPLSTCPPPSTPGPFPFPTYPHPPSTPSCYSSCSDDVASSLSDVSTPGLSGVMSGEQFVIPLPADDKMAAATLTALETCSLTPLIKEELKYTIQSRRLAAGKPELVVDTSTPVRVKKVMTVEERGRALKRREQNRVAAQRFRQKQKDTGDVLLKKCHKLEGSNTTLRTEIRRLARESQELRQLLTSHLIVCPKVKVASADCCFSAE
ncbi:hypothetical protein ACOMHN_026563 [Nucella lapillus]